MKRSDAFSSPKGRRLREREARGYGNPFSFGDAPRTGNGGNLRSTPVRPSQRVPVLAPCVDGNLVDPFGVGKPAQATGSTFRCFLCVRKKLFAATFIISNKDFALLCAYLSYLVRLKTQK
ncbi:hypothetical protein PI95_026175 [Hassallia byssoidea VB512170]|uniref:Uncharacterized protein n=1 Tax=Hassallia byssoidea VB512170 TaxID=1304833 RepID=A0A846HGK2_9CYAN|nr:hypothetical protein [Hassalia byssoidea]NEU75949.1 hypothetical protein [Hassalia byssoidea VB512170]